MMSVAPTVAIGTAAAVTGSTSHAPWLDTTSTRSIPGDRIPAPAGHTRPPVAGLSSVSRAQAAMGTVAETSVVQSTRHHEDVASTPTAARKMSAPLLEAGPGG